MINVASLWIGDRLGEIEQISARSFLDTGHRLTIYAYGPLEGVPEGVTVLDAEPIFSGRRILRYPGGSPALHSNLFRYAMMAATGEFWVDLDIIAMRRFDFSSDFIFGFEVPGRVNNAVLRLPKNSPTLGRLVTFRADTRGNPPDAGALRRAANWITTGGRGSRITDWSHGATGPRALTAFLRETGEITHSLPQETFYPVHWREAERLVTRGGITTRDIGDESYGVHLWGFHLRQALARLSGGRAEEGSFLADMRARLTRRELVRITPA